MKSQIWSAIPLLLLIVSLSLGTGATVHAQETDYKVGDRVRFEFMNEETVGTVTEIKRNGWYWVEFQWKFGDQRHILPPQKVLGLATPAAPANQPTGESRTWRDKAGKHEMQGRFVDLIDGKVKLEKDDGRQIDVGLDRLNEEDAALARSLKEAMNSAGDDNPFREVGSDANSDSDSDEPDFEVTDFDFSSVKTLSSDGGSGWNVEPETAPKTSSVLQWQQFDIEGSHCKGIAPDSQNPNRGWLGVNSIREKSLSGIIIDTETGDSIGPVTIPKSGSRVLAFHAATNRLLCITRFGKSKVTTIDVWQIKPDGEIVHEIGFCPVSGRRNVPPIRTGAFIDENRVVLATVGKAGVFDLAERKAESIIEFDLAKVPEISSDARYLFGSSNNQLVAFDLQAGKTVGRCSIETHVIRPWAMNRSRTIAVQLDNTRLDIHDLKTDKIVDVVYSSMAWGNELTFVDDDNLLVSAGRQSRLINLPLQSAIWKYGHVDLYPVPGSSEFWISGGNKRNGYGAGRVELPHPSAQQIIDSLDPAELVVLKPGQSLRLELNHGGGGLLRTQLEDHGFVISDNSPFVLRSIVDKGKNETRTYKDLTGGADETVTLSSAQYELALFHGDEKVWFYTGGTNNDPGNFVQLNPGESVGQIVKKNTLSANKFFSGIQMPDVFVRMPENGYYGFSRGGATGMNDSVR